MQVIKVMHSAETRMQPFCIALAVAFDKGTQGKETGNRVVLATQSDGSLMKPTVTLEQFATVAFKVISSTE